MHRRKRRGSVRWVHSSRWRACHHDTPPLRVAGRSKRATYRLPRQRKLSVAQVEAVRAEAGNRTLRELAAEFGVSHETIRTALRLETLSTAACERL